MTGWNRRRAIQAALAGVFANWRIARGQAPGRTLEAAPRPQSSVLISGASLLAAPRRALVIGKCSYSVGPLKNPGQRCKGDCRGAEGPGLRSHARPRPAARRNAAAHRRPQPGAHACQVGRALLLRRPRPAARLAQLPRARGRGDDGGVPHPARHEALGGAQPAARPVASEQFRKVEGHAGRPQRFGKKGPGKLGEVLQNERLELVAFKES